MDIELNGAISYESWVVSRGKRICGPNEEVVPTVFRRFSVSINFCDPLVNESRRASLTHKIVTYHPGFNGSLGNTPESISLFTFLRLSYVVSNQTPNNAFQI